MSKRAGEFPTGQCSNRCSKKPKLTEEANLIYGIPELKLGGDWNLALKSTHPAKIKNQNIKKLISSSFVR